MNHLKLQNIVSGSEGEVDYYPEFISVSEADSLFSKLIDANFWLQDSIRMFGKTISPKRLYAFMGDPEFSYTYSQNEHKARAWLKDVDDIKKRINQEFNLNLNCCLLNLYHNGTESMGWHTDNEPEMKSSKVIASLSLGAERKFKLRHNLNQETKEVTLQNGSLLLMKYPLQEHWKHALPKMLKIKEPRINLTFRTFT